MAIASCRMLLRVWVFVKYVTGMAVKTHLDREKDDSHAYMRMDLVQVHQLCALRACL
jgi:hypothetical protein